MTAVVPLVPAGETAVIVFPETVKLAASFVPNLTAETSLKPVPVIFTVVAPAASPFFGETFVTLGAGSPPSRFRAAIWAPTYSPTSPSAGLSSLGGTASWVSGSYGPVYS